MPPSRAVYQTLPDRRGSDGEDLTYREQPADARLARWVECSWTLQTDAPVRAYPVRPDGCLDLIYTAGTGAQVVGTMTVGRCFHLAAGARTFGLRFRPGMAGPFLGIAAVELTDRTIALEDVWGGEARRIEARIEDAASLDCAVRLLAGAITAPAAALDSVQLAIEAMTAAHGDIDLDRVACHSGLSARQFRRRCLEESGLAPKHLCRVLRFRRACTLARRLSRTRARTTADWAEIAATAGYFDQSHLIRDFHEFAGGTPMSVFSKTPAAPVR